MPAYAGPVTKDCRIEELTPDTLFRYGVCGYKGSAQKVELLRKAGWMEKMRPLGMRVKVLLTPQDASQGLIEYLPGEHAHRPVNAAGYMFINCIFCGFRREYKNRGWGSRLLAECLADARRELRRGVAVVVREGAFMAGNALFLKNGFRVVDRAAPDFELLVLKFDPDFPDPRFLPLREKLAGYRDGVYIFRSAQCPYTVKNVEAIVETSQAMGFRTWIVELEGSDDIARNPCAFGTFGIVHDGEIVAHHPISKTRFINIISARS